RPLDWADGEGGGGATAVPGAVACQERMLGSDHPDTLRTRNSIAMLTAETGEAHEALRLLRELVPDMLRALGPDHSHTLNSRNCLVHLTGEMGEGHEALCLFQ